jgi:ABC-type sugar transport system substrate-binding protein
MEIRRLASIGITGVFAVGMAVMTAGCDSTSFVPPPPPELNSPAVAPVVTSKGPEVPSTAVGATAGRAVELVAAYHPGEDGVSLDAAARRQAGNDAVRIKVSMLAESEKSVRQAALVREAIARHPLALVVEPLDAADADLSAAIREALDAGIPVVTFGPRAPQSKPAGELKSAASASAKRPIQVVIEPFAPTAKRLVESAMRNAEVGKLDTKGGAVILADPKVDATAAERESSIREALAAAGVTKIDKIDFVDDASARKALTDYLKANPKTTLVFSLDSKSFLANKDVCDNLSAERPFISAGYSADDNFNAQYNPQFAAGSNVGASKPVRKAVTTAVHASQGQKIPDVVEIPVLFFDSPATRGLPIVPESAKRAKFPIK